MNQTTSLILAAALLLAGLPATGQPAPPPAYAQPTAPSAPVQPAAPAQPIIVPASARARPDVASLFTVIPHLSLT